MKFIKVLKTSRFLDPAQGFAEAERYSEVRVDPLTGRTSRILDFPLREVVRADVSADVETSRGFCPFCPEVVELVTPKFHPDLVSRERYARGEALCVPNVFPYDENGAVCIISREHYVPLAAFTEQVLEDSLACCFEYLEDVVARQPDMVYQSVNWNYMPLAGGSIIPPHLQITASSSSTNYYADVVSCLARYRGETGRDYWSDLRDEEVRNAERCIAVTDRITWLAAFAPLGVFDVMGILHHAVRPADVEGETLRELVQGILHVLRYIDALNMSSLNMSLYFLGGNPQFVPHVRICPRVSIPPFGTSQVNYMKMLHDESLTTLKPEDICRDLKAYWLTRVA
jgi:UDPglucose--hexose-1-phosphate uridylyltransferase